MTLPRGHRLGPYEIVAPLGAGGMGEVYRAHDTRLDRTVAIKVLPAHLSADPTRRERFEREARAVSSLNHPHICTLFDVGREGEVDFLVMEHVEGETLAARLTAGPLPPDQVLRVAAEIADALDKAHRQGVTHRDLKPANIMITRAGAMLLDFGLAKLRAAEGAPAGGPLSALPTEGADLTADGALLGTLQYMAPEQLEGKEAGAPTDLFALGTVVYEMATGRKAFQGRSQASLIAAIMSSEPAPIATLQPLAPAALDRLVRGCLAKDPRDRWQSAHDVWLQLRGLAEAGPRPDAAGVLAAPRRLPWAWGAVTAALAGLAILGSVYLRPRPQPPSPIRFGVALPPGTSFDTRMPAVAVSPDGRMLALRASAGGPHSIWVRSLDAIEARALPGTEGATSHFCPPTAARSASSPEGSSSGSRPRAGRCRRCATSPGPWRPARGAPATTSSSTSPSPPGTRGSTGCVARGGRRSW